jgi:hypothetical protein
MEWQLKVGVGIAIVFGLLPYAVKEMPQWLSKGGVIVGVMLIVWGVCIRENIPKHFGRLVLPSSVIYAKNHHPTREIEFGDSGTFFDYEGPASEPFLKLLDRYDMTIEVRNRSLELSTRVGNDKGDLLATIDRNEWKVVPPPNTFDRNYNDTALEVRDNRGQIVLQVVLLPDHVRIQGKWYQTDGRGLSIISRGPNQGTMLELLPTPPGQPERTIKPIFVYPSDLHLGELQQ